MSACCRFLCAVRHCRSRTVGSGAAVVRDHLFGQRLDPRLQHALEAQDTQPEIAAPRQPGILGPARRPCRRDRASSRWRPRAGRRSRRPARCRRGAAPRASGSCGRDASAPRRTAAGARRAGATRRLPAAAPGATVVVRAARGFGIGAGRRLRAARRGFVDAAGEPARFRFRRLSGLQRAAGRTAPRRPTRSGPAGAARAGARRRPAAAPGTAPPADAADTPRESAARAAACPARETAASPLSSSYRITPSAHRSACAFDVGRFEPLRRQVRHAAEIVARDLAAERQRLGDPEVEDLDVAGRRQPHVARLQIAVHERDEITAVDAGREPVRGVEEAAQLARDAARLFRRDLAAADDVGEVLAVDVLHRDEVVRRRARRPRTRAAPARTPPRAAPAAGRPTAPRRESPAPPGPRSSARASARPSSRGGCPRRGRRSPSRRVRSRGRSRTDRRAGRASSSPPPAARRRGRADEWTRPAMNQLSRWTGTLSGRAGMTIDSGRTP